MWIAIVNNIPELALGITWTGLVFAAGLWAGRRIERWLAG